MKTIFSGYYPPTAAEYERLWKAGLVVLDTNVLLNLYRLPTTARDELISVLELLKDRLWIPYQVALEFQRRRLTVIAAERKATEDALSFTRELVSNVRKKVDVLQIDKRGLGIESQPLLSKLEDANSALIDAINAAHGAQLDVSSSDVVRDRLDMLLENRVGSGPASQDDLDKLIEKGEERYSENIPPGFEDADKDKNPNEATFIFDQIKYQRKFGDLILWRQLIQHVKRQKITDVLLITADRKEDWWWREQGKTIGPQPELIREIQREGGVKNFWMYTSAQFLEQSKKYLAAEVSNESVAEIEQVAEESFDSRHIRPYRRISADVDRSYPIERSQSHFASRTDLNRIEHCVAQWLKRREGSVERNLRGFPDFFVHSGEDVHGYEVKYLRDFGRMLVTPIVVNSLLRGYMETKEGRLSAFTLVVAIPQDDFFEIANSQGISALRRRVTHLLAKYPIDSIVVGSIIEDEFEPLLQQLAPSGDSDDGDYE